MWGVLTDDVRGEAVRRGDLEVTPVARRWGLRIGPSDGRWAWTMSYAAPALEVVDGDGEPDLMMLPDVGLWARLGSVALVALTVLMMGVRR